MDPMALLQYQFLMARAAEYRSIATRQAMIANARMGGFTAVGDAATAHAPELDKVRFIPMFSARGRSANFYARLDLRRRRAVADDAHLKSRPQIHLLQQIQAQQQHFMAARAMAPDASQLALVQQRFDARAGSFDDSTVARVLQNLKEDSPTHSGQARVTRDANDDSPEASRAMRDKQRGAPVPSVGPSSSLPIPPHGRVFYIGASPPRVERPSVASLGKQAVVFFPFLESHRQPRSTDPPATPRSDDHTAAASFVPPGPGTGQVIQPRSYVKRHEFWRRQVDLAEVGGRADLSVRPGAPSVDNPGGDHDKVHGSNPGDVVLDTIRSDRGDDGDGLGKRRRGEFDEDESHDVELTHSDVEIGSGSDLDRENHKLTSQDADQDAKDELTKEWAALTTWIRMNLHQPRTNKRKVLFVGHHPKHSPVPGAAARTGPNVSVSSDNASDADPAPFDAGRWRGRLGPMGERIGVDGTAIDSVNAASGSKRKGVSNGNSNGVKKNSTRVGDGDDFVFVLNPELDWDDVNVDTRVRMKTLVAETMDIFERKYSKRKVHEWEKKVQKYRPPNSVDGRTYNVPLGNVVRGIQETFYRQEAGARRAALEHDKAVGVGSGGKGGVKRVKQNVPTTPSPPRELS